MAVLASEAVLIWSLAAGVVLAIVLPYLLRFRRRQRRDHERKAEAAQLGIDRPAAQFPYIDAARCIGCGACVAACPEGDVLGVVGGTGKPISVFESGAILIYLGEKTGKLIPTDARKRVAMLEWLMWQMGGFGPMLGQAHHFLGMDKPDEYGVQRYLKETQRLYGVLDKQLASNEYVAGDEYTIADIAILGWAHRHPRHKVDLADFPNVKRWYDLLWERPAVQKGMPTLGGLNM